MGAKRRKLYHSAMEAVVAESELHGWTWTYENNKFKGKCGCGSHMFSIRDGNAHLEPRAPKNLRSTLSACKKW